jgi:hypothetical protein
VLRLYLDSLDFWSSQLLVFIAITIGFVFPTLIYTLPNSVLYIFSIYLLSLSLLLLRYFFRRKYPKFFADHSSPPYLNPVGAFLISNTICFQLFFNSFLLEIANSMSGFMGLSALIILLGIIPYYLFARQKNATSKNAIPYIALGGYLLYFLLNHLFLPGLNQLQSNPWVMDLGRFAFGSIPLFLLRLLFFSNQSKTTNTLTFSSPTIQSKS